jgi:hypothetical protein
MKLQCQVSWITIVNPDETTLDQMLGLRLCVEVEVPTLGPHTFEDDYGCGCELGENQLQPQV